MSQGPGFSLLPSAAQPDGKWRPHSTPATSGSGTGSVTVYRLIVYRVTGEKIHTSSHRDANGSNFTSANWKSADFPQGFTGSGLDGWEVFDETEV